MKIALVGVDGAGKTTILKELNKNENIKIIYMGFRNFKFQKIIDKLGKLGKIGLIIQHLLVYFENFIRIYKSRRYEKEGYIVFFDRYPVVDYQVASKTSQIIYKILYEYFFPLPDKIILIYGDPIEIYDRKPELELNEIQKLQEKIKNIEVLDIVVFNKTGYLDDTLDKIKNIIKKGL